MDNAHCLLKFTERVPVHTGMLLPALTRPKLNDTPAKLYDWRQRRFDGHDLQRSAATAANISSSRSTSQALNGRFASGASYTVSR